MKNTLFCFIICFSLSSIFCNAQIRSKVNYGYSYYSSISAENSSKAKNEKYKIKQKTITKKGKSNNTLSYTIYDTSGYIIEYSPNKKRNVKVAYSELGYIKAFSLFLKGKIAERDSFNYDEHKLIDRYYFNKKNKITQTEHYKYDSSYVTEFLYKKLKGSKLKEHRKRIYEYYPDYSYKKITYYKKGKPSYFSVFDCNPIGESHKISKDSTYNCVKYDVDSLGNKIKITIVNSRNVPLKQVEYFNEKDERIASKLFDITSNKLILAYYYLPGEWVFTKYIIYNKGKEYYKTENIFNANNICTETKRYKHGKLKETTKNTYNDKELIESSTQYNRKNKKKSETIYAYQYY